MPTARDARWAACTAAVTLLATAGAGPAAAQPPTPDPVPAGAATTMCVVDDPRAVGLSGLLATSTGYLAENDSNDTTSSPAVFVLDHRCDVTATVSYPDTVSDPEDLAVAPEGTVWVADTGDANLTRPGGQRATITLWRLPAATATAAVPYRLRYPDGPHDAEALLFNGDGTPIIITKEPDGPAGVYSPAESIRPGPDPVTLHRFGTFTPQHTGTPNPYGTLGTVIVTGAATAPDRRWVTLRTYADAYTWDVTDGDVLTAITTGTPEITPLPDEPQGEAIAATSDGHALLTISDRPGPTRLLRYPITPPPSDVDGQAQPPPGGDATAGWVAAVGWVTVVGLTLLFVGAVGVIRHRIRTARAAQPPPRQAEVD